MYKVQYLILFDKKKTKCKTVKALKNLLQSDSEIDIERAKITHKNSYKTDITIKTGKEDISTNSHLFYTVLLKCKSEDDIDKFSGLLKTVRGSLNLITQNVYVILDDLSLFYAQKAYPIIFDIENLMRQLITKFMLTNVGVGWTKDRVPTEVQQSINPNNKDINFLNNVDFIQLKNFLFSDNYPNHKDSLIKKLKNANDFSNLDLDEIKSLLPESNWEKFFEPIVGCDADYIKKRWDKLYDLRCKVAHNKAFIKCDLENVNKLASELKTHLEKALNSLDKIIISEEERVNVAENVAINLNEKYGEFIQAFRHLENIIFSLVNKNKSESMSKKRFQYGNATGILLDLGIINDRQYKDLKSVFYFRNEIVHHSNSVIKNSEYNKCMMRIYDFIRFFENYSYSKLNREVPNTQLRS